MKAKMSRYIGEVSRETLKLHLKIGEKCERGFLNHCGERLLSIPNIKLIDVRSRREIGNFYLRSDNSDVIKMDVKCIYTRFRKAKEFVSLSPENCFPIAIYKIVQGHRREIEEQIPYLLVCKPAWKKEWRFMTYAHAIKILQDKIETRFQYHRGSQENMHYDFEREMASFNDFIVLLEKQAHVSVVTSSDIINILKRMKIKCSYL